MGGMGRNIKFLISVVDTKIKEKYRVTQYCSCKPMSSDPGWIVTTMLRHSTLFIVLVHVGSLLKKVKIQVRHCQAVYIINTRPTCGWVWCGGGEGVNRKQRTAPCCWHLTVLRSVRLRGQTRLVYLCQSFTPAPSTPATMSCYTSTHF